MLYLDTAASYPLLPEVKIALKHSFDEIFANSSSSHLLGSKVNDRITEVREQLAAEIGAMPSEIIFTSGATESNNIAFKSVMLGGDIPSVKKHIITTKIEHKCVLAISAYLETLGYDVTYVKPNESGIVEPLAIKKALRSDTALVSVMHVNNELGTINPIAQIGQLCFENNIIFHSDAAQSFQKSDIDVDDMNVDLMSFSAHKIGGPKGIGAIYIRDLRSRKLQPVIHGASQEEGIRGGTVAAPLVIGFGSAVEHFRNHYKSFGQLEIKTYFLEQLKNNSIAFTVNGSLNTLPSCVSVTLNRTNVSTLIRATESELCLAQGSACSSQEIEASHVLAAIGLTREEADKTLRISFPLNITQRDIGKLVALIKQYSV